MRRLLGSSALVAAIVVGLGFGTRDVSFWDPAFYVAQLTSLWYDGDLILHDDLASMDAQPIFRLHALTRLEKPGGALANAFSIGPAVLNSPIAAPVLLAQKHAGAERLGAPVRVALAASALAMVAVLVTALEVLLARARAGRIGATLVVACVLMGTPIMVYAFADYYMAHLPSAACAAAFTAAALGWARSPTVARAGLAGISAGLLAIVRWQDVCYAAWLAPIVMERLAHVPEARRRIARTLPVMVVSACAVASIQSAAWWQQFGLLATIPQGRGFMRWTDPQLVEVLFDSAHGLLPWSPIVAVAVLGSVHGAVTQRRLWRAVHLGNLAVVVLETYVNASAADWWGGSAYGPRRFCSLAPVFALGVAEMFRMRWARRARWAITGAVAVWAIVCLRQVVHDGGEFAAWSLSALVPHPSLDGLRLTIQRWTVAVPWAALAVAWIVASRWVVVRLAGRDEVRRRTWVVGTAMALGAAVAIFSLRPRAIDLAERWSAYLTGAASADDVRARGFPDAPLDFVEAVVCEVRYGPECPNVAASTRSPGGSAWLATAKRLVRSVPEIAGRRDLDTILRSPVVVLRAVAIEALRTTSRSCRVAGRLAATATTDPAEVVRITASRAMSEIRDRAGCRVSEPEPVEVPPGSAGPDPGQVGLKP